MHGLVAIATDHGMVRVASEGSHSAGLRLVVTRWHRVNEGEHVLLGSRGQVIASWCLPRGQPRVPHPQRLTHPPRGRPAQRM